MPAQRKTYLSRKININKNNELTINKKQIDYEHDRRERKWSSKYLPYTQYNSLLDLAKAIIRDSAEF